MYAAHSRVPWLPSSLPSSRIACPLMLPCLPLFRGLGGGFTLLKSVLFQVYLVFTYSILAWAAQLLFCFEVVINIPPVMFLDGLVKLRKALIEFLL